MLSPMYKMAENLSSISISLHYWDEKMRRHFNCSYMSKKKSFKFKCLKIDSHLNEEKNFHIPAGNLITFL